MAKQAVNCAPSEFVTWAKLTECYIELGQYEAALLTLNSCPMFTYNDRDLHRMPTPSRTHLPVKQFISDSQILDGENAEEDTDPSLLRLPAPGLRGTFAKAYALLCRLVSEIGWDELLKTRSSVFVMEEEYRNQKASHQREDDDEVEDQHVNGVVYEDGSVRDSTITAVASGDDHPVDADDDASIRGMVSPTQSDHDASKTENGIPSIHVSSEGDSDEPEESSETAVNGVKTEHFGDKTTISKPERAASDVDEEEDSERKREIKASEALSLNNKRLCERWLDNMFMCLYEVTLFYCTHG